jgi:tetratricopeptide (TPR) repeat protein
MDLPSKFRKNGKSPESKDATPPSSLGASTMIRVFDSYGRQMEVPRETWRRDVLLPNFDKNKDNPEALYGLIVQSLRDGFIEEALAPAQRLTKIDPDRERAQCLHGIVLLQLKRFPDAKEVLENCIARLGERGYVLTNLAKAYAGLGQDERAEQTLWHALELDPNQDNALSWYAVLFRERQGEAGQLAAYQRVAGLTNSWRAQLWIARSHLAHDDIQAAARLYRDVLAKLSAVPTDALMQISGDLGNKGQLELLLRLCRPYFVAKEHGLQVGNNLIKAYVDLKDFASARVILEQLYAQQRPDWRDHLLYWDKQIEEPSYGPVSTPPSVGLLVLENPVWAHGVLGFESLLPKKSESSPRIAFMCGSGDPGVKDGDPVLRQRSNDLGRFTRAMPMFLAEELQIQTDARSSFALPWIKGGGFVLSANPWRYEDLKMDGTRADYLALVHVDARQTSWTMRLEVLSASDGAPRGTWDKAIELQRPGSTASEFIESVIKAVGATRQPQQSKDLLAPQPERLAQYFVALEQALAVAAANIEDSASSYLYEERSIFDNLLSLALDTPACIRTRCLLLNTLEKEARRRPDIAREYREKIQRLQKEHPLKAGPTANLVAAAIATLETKTSGQ